MLYSRSLCKLCLPFSTDLSFQILYKSDQEFNDRFLVDPAALKSTSQITLCAIGSFFLENDNESLSIQIFKLCE